MDDDEKTRSPLFPSDYVTLAHLKERWIKEKERKQREEDPKLTQKGKAAESKPPSRSSAASAPEVGEASLMDDKRMGNPSFPSNYVTLVQLQERWIKEKERKQREEGEEDRRLKQKGLRDGAAEAAKVAAESKPPSGSPEASAQVEVAGDRETKTTVKKKESKQKGRKNGKSRRELNPLVQDAVAGKEALGEPPFSNAEKDGVGGDTRSLEAYSGVSSSNQGFGRGGSRKSHGRRTAGVEAGEARALSRSLEEKTDLETKSRVLSVDAVIKEEDERLSRRNGGGGDKVDEPVGKSREKGRDKGEARSEGNIESRFKDFPGNDESVRNRNAWKGRDKSKGTSREIRAESEIPDLKAEIEPVRDLPENGVARDRNEDSSRRGKKQIGFVRRTIGDTELESSSVDQTAGIEHKDRALPVRCGAGKRNDRSKDKVVPVRRNEEGVEGRVEPGAGSESSDPMAEIEHNLWALGENGVVREGIEESRRRGKKQDMVWRRTGGETKPKSDALDQTAVSKHKVRALPVKGRAGKRNDRSRMEKVRFSRNEEVVGDKDETRAVSESSDLTAEIESGLRNFPVNGLAWEGNEGSARRDKKQEKLARRTGDETKPENNALNPTTGIQEVRAFPVKVGAGKKKKASRKKGALVSSNVETKAESANSDQLVGMETKVEVFSINIATEEENVGFRRNTEKEEITGIGFETMAGNEGSDPTADIEPDFQAWPKNGAAREWIEESGRRGRNQDMFWQKTGGETKPKSNALDQTAGTKHKVSALPINGWAGRRTEAGYVRGFKGSQSSQAGRFSHRGVSHGRDSGNGMVWVKKDYV